MKFHELSESELLKRARKFEEKREYEKCVKYLERILELNPESYDALVELGTIYATDYCYDLPLSFSYNLRAIALDPTRYEAWNNAAWCSVRTNTRHTNADTIALYTRAYPLAPADEQEEILSAIAGLSGRIENPLRTRLRLAKLRNSKAG